MDVEIMSYRVPWEFPKAFVTPPPRRTSLNLREGMKPISIAQLQTTLTNPNLTTNSITRRYMKKNICNTDHKCKFYLIVQPIITLY